MDAILVLTVLFMIGGLVAMAQALGMLRHTPSLIPCVPNTPTKNQPEYLWYDEIEDELFITIHNEDTIPGISVICYYNHYNRTYSQHDIPFCIYLGEV